MQAFTVRVLYFFLFLSFISLSLRAQVKVRPLIETPAKGNLKGSNLRVQGVNSLSLPFFDDFSTYRSMLDTLVWVDSGGTLLNNSLALNPPTLNVITFDGLDKNGNPRNNFGSSLSSGIADSLASQYIDLSAVSPSANVYLSFMWQAQGLGEQPDLGQSEEDSLIVYFKRLEKTPAGKDTVIWTKVWSQEARINPKFRFAVIPVADLAYFHSSFQFLLVSYGNLAGAFDTWNVDYFYLNEGRNAGDTIFTDVALTNLPSTFLKNYQSMPYWHYARRPEVETADSLKINVYNLNSTFKALQNVSVRLINGSSNQELGALISANTSPLVSQFSSRTLSFKLDYTKVPPSTTDSSLNLKFKYDLLTTESGNFLKNDTITVSSILKDYYAYDDGSAERTFTVEGINSKLAYKFYVPETEVISGIDVYFPKEKSDITGKTMRLFVWSNIGIPDSVVKSVSVSAVYSNGINKFTRYTFPKGELIQVKDTFYVGFEQMTRDPIPVGFDKNTNAQKNIFYKLGGSKEWNALSQFSGSLMIRPVFRSDDGTVATDPELGGNKFKIYPNPSRGIVTVKGGAESISIVDPVGRTVFSGSLSGEETEEVDLRRLDTGLYIVRLQKNSKTYSEKLIIRNE